MKVLWITNIPSPYRMKFFSELGSKCELTVLFERAFSYERNESWRDYKFQNFNGIVMKGINTGVDTAICIEVVKYLKKGVYDIIVISNVSTLTGMLAIEILNIKKIPFIIEGDGAIAKSGNGFKEKIKTHLNKNAVVWFSTGENHDKYYLKYGANKNNICRYPFTSLMENDILNNLIDERKKAELKEKHKLPKNKKIVLAVGRFIYLKGFDILIESLRNIKEEYYLLIIGGGEEKDRYYKLIKKYNLKNIELKEFIDPTVLKEYYMLADLFVHPTRKDIWGLVINEAMSYGLPVITTDKCVAGLELIEDCSNGFIVPANNIKKLSDRIGQILNNEELRKNMCINNLKKVKKYTIENMANIHIDYFNKLIINGESELDA
ncbi:glycosyltransferase [Clostridium tarantellae]|uniref:Glycosyltransferase n=1 Tax=Clostridium tarantellae TaxID=39493 RepID=A0A6I1MU76_9CLOT|nr:glycosyltransferase [Clostridium tarantellae]MPQ44411.1 glycosyltransferase [Clostridium tarantellae]